MTDREATATAHRHGHRLRPRRSALGFVARSVLLLLLLLPRPGSRRPTRRLVRSPASASPSSPSFSPRRQHDAPSSSREMPATTAPESPLEPPSIWQKLLQMYNRISKKNLILLILLGVCVAVGFFGNKGDPRALFIIDVLDKANKAYKPCSEFVLLVIAIIASLFPR